MLYQASAHRKGNYVQINKRITKELMYSIVRNFVMAKLQPTKMNKMSLNRYANVL